MNAVLTPNFFDSAWSPTHKAEISSPYVPLAFVGAGGGFGGAEWKLHGCPPATTARDWTAAVNKVLVPEDQLPSEVSFGADWDDSVSVLNDDPDVDDVDILPSSTYNVLLPIFDEIYKDDSEAYDEQEPPGRARAA